jgi:outer membrane protein
MVGKLITEILLLRQIKKAKKMMKKLLKISILLAITSFAVQSGHAQKFGHVNVGNILIKMPHTLAADSLLKTYQDSLVAIGQVKANALQTDIAAFSKEYNAGNLTPVASQAQQEALQKRRDEILAYEDEIRAAVADKRKELLGPILDKVQTAISEVGKENKYTMIFDTSAFNTILYARDSDDVTSLVMAKIGLK